MNSCHAGDGAGKVCSAMTSPDLLPVPSEGIGGRRFALFDRRQFLEAAVPDDVAPKAAISRMVDVFKKVVVDAAIHLANHLLGIHR